MSKEKTANHPPSPATQSKETCPGRTSANQGKQVHLLNCGVDSLTRDISQAIVTKNGNLYFLTQPDGNIPLDENHGLGLYLGDCRYLSGYEIRLADQQPFDTLVSSAAAGFMSLFEFSTPQLQLSDGQTIKKQSLGIQWKRMLAAEQTALYDLAILTNYDQHPLQLPLSLTFQARFEDIFSVRGHETGQRGQLHAPAWHGHRLDLAYDGADQISRYISIQFSRPPTFKDGATARFDITIEAGQSVELMVLLHVYESRQQDHPTTISMPDLQKVKCEMDQAEQTWLKNFAQVHTTSPVLKNALQRSLNDLRVLRSKLDADRYIAAGVPWYVTLFGRDSIITALQLLAFNPRIAEETLRLLAKYQGDKNDPRLDEEPGKILHEYRNGEMAHLGEIPYAPAYYGSVDSTPLFLILLVEHAHWTGQLALLHELQGTVERALDWMKQNCQHSENGYLIYASQSRNGLVNQGWKDSGNAIINDQGQIAEPPIALAEVQGYYYRALKGVASLYRRAGNAERSNQLRQQANQLKERFNRDFWMADQGCFCLGLEKGGRQLKVVASNAGQVLWGGIADTEKAHRTVDRLMQPDMYSGWGIRTLSAHAAGYNPIAYQVGAVWPHDNALIAAGMRQYQRREQLLQIFDGILSAANHFNTFRLPECFAGFDRNLSEQPVRYSVACHPQAWAAGALPYLLTQLLGLSPDAFDNKLTVYSPILPHYVDQVDLSGLKVGQAQLNLRFIHRPDGHVELAVLHQQGNLKIVEQQTAVAGG